MDSFYVVAPSNTVGEGNKSSRFTIRLPEILELDSNWTVGLSSIIYPVSFREEISKESDHMELLYRTDAPYHGEPFRVPVTSIKHNTLRAFDWSINKCLWEAYGKLEGVHEKHIDETRFPRLEKGFKFSEETNRFQFIAPPPFMQIRLTKQLAYMLGFDVEVVDSGEIAKYPPDLIGDTRQIFCYAPNLVENTIIGNVTAPLLRVINVKDEDGAVAEDIYSAEHHHRLLSKRISEITIELRNSIGKLIPFSWGTVIAILHFKRNLF